MHRRRTLRAHLAVTTAILAALAVPGAALAQPVPDDRGAVAAGLLIRQLDGIKRVLVIGAHPDDEDTSLLTALARGAGAEAAYLALTRGEGGQNLIGPELGEGLGLVRTGELVAARGLDGGRQFFTRAIDYGYSKSADEAFRHWPREQLLHDVVWVIRTFRPQVIVSIFSGTPLDGHGQHQAAGIMAQEGFEAAGDPGRFPEQLRGGVEPWQPLKLYQLFRRNPGEATAVVQTGTFDPLLARSYYQVAMESRSQHRSQDMGAYRPLGPRSSRVGLVRSLVSSPAGDEGLFAGIDTTLAALAADLPAPVSARVVGHIEGYRAQVRAAEASLDALNPQRSAGPLASAVRSLDRALAELESAGGNAAAAEALRRRREMAGRALLATSSVILDVRSDADLVVPGEDFEVRVDLWNGGPFRVTQVTPNLALPPGWSATMKEAATVDEGGFGPFRSSVETVSGVALDMEPGEIRRWAFRVHVPEDAALSRQYFLAQPPEGDLYRWPERREHWGRPGNPPVVAGSVSLNLDPEDGGPSLGVGLSRPGTFVGVDKADGEFRKPILVVPRVSVTVDPGAMAWPTGSGESRPVGVSLSVRTGGTTGGTVQLDAPPGWTVEPSGASFELSGTEATRTVTFQVRPPADLTPGDHLLAAVARTADGREYREGVHLIDYPHIERVARFTPAEARVTAFPVVLAPGLTVGYVMGSGDLGPEALRQMGATVELLDAAALRGGDLDRFDVLVGGDRAYETRPDLAGSNGRILDFARRGGTVVVQYSQYEFNEGPNAPYPLEIARPQRRVADETAAVTLLDPLAPVFTTPNRITGGDFDGWLQERGLYFPGEWDSRYTPLLEMSDPGEEPLRGALLVAPVGEGVYVYTALSFFRQFGKAVPGAYRLFANLVSLDPTAWRARLSAGR